MRYVSDTQEKVDLIREVFSNLIGRMITGYEIAQMWSDEDHKWTDWMDLPLYLIVGDKAISISWTQFDDMAIETGRSIPFSLAGSTVRWISEGNEVLDTILGNKIDSVSLGRGRMEIEKKDIEIWTRLLINLSSGSTFEVYNALDENRFSLHNCKAECE